VGAAAPLLIAQGASALSGIGSSVAGASALRARASFQGRAAGINARLADLQASGHRGHALGQHRVLEAVQPPQRVAAVAAGFAEEFLNRFDEGEAAANVDPGRVGVEREAFFAAAHVLNDEARARRRTVPG